MRKRLNLLINWFRQNNVSLLHVLLFFYIYLIPIWPKLPFININYTYIAVRYEDFFVVMIALVFAFDLIRKKVTLKKDWFLILIPLYWLAVLAASLSGFYLTKTVITLQLGLLHAFRRVEYMLIFFIAYAAVKNNKQLRFYLNQIIIVLSIVSIYGIGQKFLGWPAVQTMNPHYSKGYLLTLDANARISSTFGGHYDLAAYLIFLIPLCLGLFLTLKKLRYFVVFVIALLTLILTASRVSYGAYLVTVPILLLILKRFRLLAIVIILTLVLTPLSSNLTKRINRTFRQELVWVSPETGKTIVPRDNTSIELPAGDFVIKSTATVPKTKKQVKLVKRELANNILDEARKSGKELSAEELDRLVEEAFSKFKPMSSVLPDISFATRLQVEWPRAVKAFLSNPLLGTGPSSITESTDNDYLRSLGETGILGFGLLMLILLKLQYWLFQQGLKFKEPLRPFFWGLLFGGLALMINATYIDVFEASKVALVIWLVWGMVYKVEQLNENPKKLF